MSGKEFGENRKFIFYEKMTFLPFDHHGGHNVGPIIFILGKNAVKYKDMPLGKGSAEIRNSKWSPRGFFRVIVSPVRMYTGYYGLVVILPPRL